VSCCEESYVREVREREVNENAISKFKARTPPTTKVLEGEGGAGHGMGCLSGSFKRDEKARMMMSS
jgi:hypothetical protein